jgi:hypothetical protein
VLLVHEARDNMVGIRNAGALRYPKICGGEDCDSTQNTKYSRMDKRLKHFPKWTPRSVEQRTENLVSLANNLWALE